MSQSPPLFDNHRVMKAPRANKVSTTEEQLVSDPGTQSQQAPLMKPNPYSRKASKAIEAGSSQLKQNFTFLSEHLYATIQAPGHSKSVRNKSLKSHERNKSSDLFKPKKEQFNYVNPEKFIMQNNFIPVPQILMNQTVSNNKVIESSGEHLTQEGLSRIRHLKQRRLMPQSVPPVAQRDNSEKTLPQNSGNREGPNFMFTPDPVQLKDFHLP